MIRNLSEAEKLNIRYLIALISSQINGTAVPFPPEGISWKQLFYFAEKGSLLEILSSAVLSLPDEYKPDEQMLKKAVEHKGQGLIIDTNLQYEVELVLQAFEKEKITNCPLKGYFLKHEYPDSYFRTVSDFDILIDRSDIEKIDSTLVDLGYKFDSVDDTQFHYIKKPFMCLEMHYSLVHEFELYYNALKDQLDRTIPREGYNYSRQMNIEDFYLYLIIHHSNHFRIAGLGIRMVLDVYIYYKKYCEKFNYDYLNRMLSEMKLDAFEKRIRGIAFSWFAESELKIAFDRLESYILQSATLGTVDVSVMISEETKKDNGKSKGKISSILSRVFPPYKSMKGRYRYLEKAPVLLPISWIQLWGKRVFVDKDLNVKKGLKRLDYKNEDVDYIKGVFSEVGFDDIGYSRSDK